MTYFPAMQYHRRSGLNCCVRDGNRCFPRPLVTDKSPARLGAGREMVCPEDPDWTSAIRSCPAARTRMGDAAGTRNGVSRLLETTISGEDRRSTSRATWHRGQIAWAGLARYGGETPSHRAWSGPDGLSRRLAGMIKHSTVRTVRLRAFQPLHPRPINLVVYQGSFAFATMPHLKGGFTLRCLQRLSLPNVATQRCTERCNWITRGWSNPILSY